MNRKQDKRYASQCAYDLTVGQKFVIADFETTGFENDDEIIQIGSIDQDGHVLLDTLVKPVQPIRNSDYHGIHDAMVADAPTFPRVYPLIRAALEGKIVLAYNYAYDSRMLDQVCARHGLEPIVPLQSACIMELYAQFYGEWNDYRGNYKWQKLRDALANFELAFEGDEHNAVTDCRAALAVLLKMAGWYQKQVEIADAQKAVWKHPTPFNLHTLGHVLGGIKVETGSTAGD